MLQQIIKVANFKDETQVFIIDKKKQKKEHTELDIRMFPEIFFSTFICLNTKKIQHLLYIL